MKTRNTLRADLGRSLASGAGDLELVAAGALLLHTNRLALDACLSFRLRTGTRYARMDGILQQFILDLVRADPDTNADVLRVQILALQLPPADSPVIRSAVTAMERVASAGAAPSC